MSPLQAISALFSFAAIRPVISAGNSVDNSLNVINSNKNLECPLTLKSPVGILLYRVEAVKLKIEYEGLPGADACHPIFSQLK